MLAALLTRPGQIETVDLPEPREPGATEVLVAVRRVGICGTDYHAYAGRQNFFGYPRVLGHELAVEVLATGADVERVSAGDYCAVLPYVACGTCTPCLRGRSNCCERIDVLGVTVDGGMCERMVLPASLLYSSPGLSLDQLALVETLGIGWHAVERSRPDPGDTVLVVGAGPIGLAVALCVRDRVAEVVISDISPERLRFAADLGLTTLPAGDRLGEQAAQRHDGGPPSLVFDATGNKASMEGAFGLAGAGGTLVFVGHTTGSLTFDNPGFHARELDVRASRNAVPSDWAGVLDAVAGGSLDAMAWVNHRTTLASIATELPELADRADVVKAIIDIDSKGQA